RLRQREEDDVSETAPQRRIEPGKLTTAQSARVDRRAEPGGDDIEDQGALSTAYQFLGTARGGQPLPADLVARLSRDLGVDLSSIRVHTNEAAARASAALRARAFTIGTDIYFAAGAYEPSSDEGIALIAHEAAHVAQNVLGSAPARPERVSRPDDAHER